MSFTKIFDPSAIPPCFSSDSLVFLAHAYLYSNYVVCAHTCFCSWQILEAMQRAWLTLVRYSVRLLVQLAVMRKVMLTLQFVVFVVELDVCRVRRSSLLLVVLPVVCSPRKFHSSNGSFNISRGQLSIWRYPAKGGSNHTSFGLQHVVQLDNFEGSGKFSLTLA